MGWMSTVERGGMRASVDYSPMSDFWYGPAGGSSTYAGVPVSPDVAMRVSVVFACVEVLSTTLASLPLVLYRRLPDGGKKKALDHPLYPILARRPNSWQSRFEFVEYLVRQLFLRGGAFAEKDLQTLELLPLHPDRVQVEQLDNRRLRYRITPVLGAPYTRTQDDMLQIRDASEDTVTGQSRTILAREAIAVAAAAERFSGRWLQNDGSGRVVMEHPAKLDATTRADIRAAWNENSAGWANRGKMLLAEGGVKVTTLPGLQESGFLIDPRKFQLAEICRYFGRVPPFMIGHEDKTTWGTNIEQIKSAFVAFCAQPVGTRIEQAMMRDLLPDEEQDEYFIAFMYEELLRGDLLSVVQALAIQRQQGLLSPNEGRAILNRNPRTDPGGDEYQNTPPSAAPNAPAAPEDDPPAPDPEPPDDPAEPEAATIPAPIIADAVARIANAEIRAVRADAKGPEFRAWVVRFYGKHRGYAERVLAGVSDPHVAATAAARIERTAVAVLDARGAPAGWAGRRATEIAEIVNETLQAAAAVRRAA